MANDAAHWTTSGAHHHMQLKPGETVQNPCRQPDGQAVMAYRYDTRTPPVGELVALVAPTFRGLKYRAESGKPTTEPRPFRIVPARLRPGMWKSPAAALVGKEPDECVATTCWLLEDGTTEAVSADHVWMLASELASVHRC